MYFSKLSKIKKKKNQCNGCRDDAQVCAEAVCNTRLPLPDLGFGSHPQRVSDPSLGTFCVEPLEDVLLFSEKKSELVAVLADLRAAAAGVEGNPLRAEAAAAGGLPTAFDDALTMRPSRSAPGLSLVPAIRITFKAAASKVVLFLPSTESVS